MYIMIWLTILAFAVSASIDNLGVGMSYGIQKVHIQMKHNLLIAVICFVFSLIGIYFGMWMLTFIPGKLPVIIGAIILLVIGVRIILLGKAEPNDTEVVEAETNLTNILKNPEVVGNNPQKKIGWIESTVLGIALSANAITNGIGAGLFGLSPLTLAVATAIGSFISIWLGVQIGRRMADVRIGSYTLGQFGTVISGGILVIIAVVAVMTISF